VRDIYFGPTSMARRYSSPRGKPRRKPGSLPDLDWRKRYSLFSKYDMGILMDSEAWFEVTPENIARYISSRVPIHTEVLDAFCGVGGNTIQFAHHHAVIAVDSSSERVKMATTNSAIYGVQRSVKFVCEDITRYLQSTVFDGTTVFYASPPWGGRHCYDEGKVGLDSLPVNMKPIVDLALSKMSSLILHLPRNLDLADLASYLSSLGVRYFEVERIYFTHPEPRLKCLVVFIDKSITGRASVLSIGHIARRESISNCIGSSLAPQISRKALLSVTYLGRYMSRVLMDVPGGFSSDIRVPRIASPSVIVNRLVSP
jgi:trimethylguanosine synthase